MHNYQIYYQRERESSLRINCSSLHNAANFNDETMMTMMTMMVVRVTMAMGMVTTQLILVAHAAYGVSVNFFN